MCDASQLPPDRLFLNITPMVVQLDTNNIALESPADSHKVRNNHTLIIEFRRQFKTDTLVTLSHIAQY